MPTFQFTHLLSNEQARLDRDSELGEADPEHAPHENMLMMRLLGPLVNFVDRPWKVRQCSRRGMPYEQDCR